MKRLAMLAAVPLLVAGLMAFTGGRASAVSQAAQPTPSQTCILVIICFPAASSPSPTPSASTAAPSSSPSASAAVPSGAASSAVPTPTVGLTGTPAASASASATPSAGSPSPTGSPSASPSPTPTQPKDASAAAGLVVSNVTWTMSVGSASMTGFTYKGNVNLPLAGGGTIQMMEFTVASMSLSNAVTQISENGQTGTETDGSFSASGVTMYATQLSGTLVAAAGISVPGIPLSFTPSTLTVANLLKLPNIGELQLADLITSSTTLTLNNVTADQTVILAGQAQKTTIGVTD
jgi:hypothetical protein